MNIVFVAALYYPHIGGVEKHIRELSRELSQDGHHVTVIVEKHDPSCSSHEECGPVEVVRLNRSSKRFIKTLYRYWQICGIFPKVLKADVLHFHDYSMLWAWLPFVLILRMLGKRFFITFHGWEGHCPPQDKVIRQRKIAERLSRGNICVGDYIEKWYGTKADIISYGGVATATRTGVEKEDMVLFVGRLAPDTGLVQYLAAWKMVSPEFPTFKLVICGDGSLKEWLVKYLGDERLISVTLEGFVEDVDSYLARSKVVFTSGYLGILEAFSYVNAVVAIYDNELKKDYLEMIPGSREMMWIAKDEVEIAACMREALAGSDKPQVAYRYARENDWNKVKKSYYELWAK
jgi:glycosyltransferase involved in cell wall biosynthesis